MAGGGTGGHLFPALALAAEFGKRGEGIEITFAGARGGLEERVVPRHGYPLILFDVEGIKRRTGLKRVSAVFRAFGATLKAVRILKELRPDGVIGSGSYSSAPVVMAARMLGIKTAIMEQNAMPGLTNRILGKVVKRIYIAFPEARAYFPSARTLLTGNPVRMEIIEKIKDRAVGIRDRDDRFTVLVFGGSQGATAINAAFLDAAEFLTDVWPNLRVIHQTGEEGYESALAAYKRKRLKVDLYKFIDDMAGAYFSSDLAVCRAGATSIAELTAFGLAMILVPYPFAADDHQSVNARSLTRAGAAVTIRQDKLTGRSLADAVRRFYEDRAELKRTSANSRALGRPGAAGAIAEDFLGMLGPKGARSNAG